MEDLWVVWLVLEMLAEPDYEIVDRAGVGVFLQAPDLFEDRFSGDGSAFVLDQVLQQFCFHQRERDYLIAIFKLEVFKIYKAAVYLSTGRSVLGF